MANAPGRSNQLHPPVALPPGERGEGRGRREQIIHTLSCHHGPALGEVRRLSRCRHRLHRDTVGMIRLRRREAFTSGTGARLSVEVTEDALSPEDPWHMRPDGRVAAARTDGCYVEWIDNEFWLERHRRAN